MQPDLYLCITPYGVVQATFPPGSCGVDLQGPSEAVAMLRREIEGSTDMDGMSLGLESLEPDQLMMFCQRPGRPMLVIPPFLDESDEKSPKQI